MKHLLITALGILWSTLLAAQLYVEGTLLSPSNTGAYIEVTPLRRTDGTYHMGVDYGQTRGRRPHDCLTDNKGRRYEFRSAVDGLNFLHENGWEVVVVYPVEDIRRYLMKRR
ncbi:MAG: hypothetical protein RMJ33_06845 [Saprospiraceae bacterium]|nr:hypothetical protein [Saprospiraceae bacterium]MDW8229539.1 hypothetical protein [Saprospiraceae bacterium]